ncbi:YggS family pyridoxal phosphate enzyme [Batrachochytrium dendrobatidis JEL423]|uniref:Pyridoxal phosphate homeostasis protein n=1 Tax=Batrachochytrium dendrobatidis (strain JEL423) TaxID=403673 RepID=A0A177WSV2_BATDL|nr:YggS family pyridoxal phosphate enzyme [Batrachochytrium dendrobatidis JEL423]
MQNILVDKIRKQEIADNIADITNRIQSIPCKHSWQKQIRLVAVSKTKPASDIAAAYELGHRHFGENVQELVEKASILPSDIHWHFIGSIQSNKCKALADVPNLWTIETIDSSKKALTMNKACQKLASPLRVFLQINTSGEASCRNIKMRCLKSISGHDLLLTNQLVNLNLAKSGILPSNCVMTAKEILDECDKLELIGLMCIGAPHNAKNDRNPDFDLLVECKQQIEAAFGMSGLELSMGMSDDFESAIEYGSTNIRVGSSIFGSRSYTK